MTLEQELVFRTDAALSSLSDTPRSPGLDARGSDTGQAYICSPYPGQVVDGRYRLGALLGHGGMGWVFEATHVRTDKRVAIKYLVPQLQTSPHCVNRFLREARAAGRLDHPNVVRVYDSGGEGANAYLVMELLYGETLRSRLRRGRIEPREAIEIMQAVMRGVAEAHRHSIVHRDLKPENIMLARLSDGTPDQPKVLDFGVSQGPDASTAEAGSTSLPSAASGTPHYMPIEQLQGEPGDRRMDVYALGVVLYEMLRGRPPFMETSREALISTLKTQAPPPLQLDDDALGRRLDRVLQRALARRASDRFATVHELAQALERLQGKGAVRETEPSSRLQPGMARGPGPVVAGGIAALALALGGALIPREPAPGRLAQLTHRGNAERAQAVAARWVRIQWAAPRRAGEVEAVQSLPRPMPVQAKQPRRAPRGLFRARRTAREPQMPPELQLHFEDF